MYAIPLKNPVPQQFVPPLYPLKTKGLIIRILLFVFILEMIICIFVAKESFLSDKTSDVAAVMVSNKTGLETEQFLIELKNAGLNPILSQKIMRAPFSVGGVMIILSGDNGENTDNIQVFEYFNQETALKEVLFLEQKYAAGIGTNSRNKTVHLYTRGALVIFYMGTEKNILFSLDKTVGHFLTSSL